MPDAFLVVGADSLVGGGLLRAMARRGLSVYGTTRRRDTLSAHRLFFDFEASSGFVAPRDVATAVVVAAATNYERCEKDPLARVINVELTPRRIGELLAQGLHVLFISTNSVFGGERPWPHEDDPHDPRIPYAVQKHEAEMAVLERARALGASDRLGIVRLTKILAPDTPPLPAWFSAWQKNEPISPFADLIFAPMSVQYVGEALATLAEQRVAGNVHLSGAENVSYVTFAQALATAKGIDPSLIQATTATERGVHIAFKPTYSGLGMSRTTALTGLVPQKLDSVIRDLVSPYPDHNPAQT